MPHHELQESSKEKNAGEDSETHELNLEGGEQKDSESEGAISPGEEERHAEEGTAEALVNSKNAPEAEGTPGTRERIWELTTLENQSGEKNKMITKIHDKLVKEDDGYQGEGSESVATQNDERSPETPNSLTAEFSLLATVSPLPGNKYTRRLCVGMLSHFVMSSSLQSHGL